MIAENEFGTGFIPDIITDRNYVFAGREDAFDWSMGFDIEQKIRNELKLYKYRLEPNDQKRTGSCVAQAWDKYGEVKYLLNKKREINLSPRYIYSHIHLPNGGAYIYNGGAWIRDNGSIPDDILPSVPTTEQHLRNKGITEYDDTLEIFKQLIRGGKILSVWRNIDLFAKAIRENDGLVFGVGGSNNGTWRSEFPKPPKSVDDVEWGHSIYAGKAKMIGGKKYIGILNSWGHVGDKGWQWLGENYINKMFAFTGFTWTPTIGEIKDVKLFKEIEQFIQSNNLKWFKTAGWAKVKANFNTDLSRGNYYDWLQAKKYI